METTFKNDFSEMFIEISRHMGHKEAKPIEASFMLHGDSSPMSVQLCGNVRSRPGFFAYADPLCNRRGDRGHFAMLMSLAVLSAVALALIIFTFWRHFPTLLGHQGLFVAACISGLVAQKALLTLRDAIYLFIVEKTDEGIYEEKPKTLPFTAKKSVGHVTFGRKGMHVPHSTVFKGDTVRFVAYDDIFSVERRIENDIYYVCAETKIGTFVFPGLCDEVANFVNTLKSISYCINEDQE